MVKGLLRLALVVIILVAVGGFLLGWWTRGDETPDRTGQIGTTGEQAADSAREATADLGDRAATAAGQARNAVEDGALTAKIKSKMALDDSVEALEIDIDTVNGVVTLTGTVDTDAQEKRALQLARETDGVTRVVDRLEVRR